MIRQIDQLMSQALAEGTFSDLRPNMLCTEVRKLVTFDCANVC